MSKFLDNSLQIKHNDLTQNKGFILSAILKNEIYILPSFLKHYRALGVERFYILDDNSDDGSLEYLAAQPDVMLLESEHNYGAPLPVPRSDKLRRAMLAWRNSIPEYYIKDQWHLHVDVDEFIDLPKGVFVSDFTTKQENTDIVWANMIDLYPRIWDDILQEPTPQIENIRWFFDARPHYKFYNFLKNPHLVYSGARARLRENFMTVEKQPEKITHKFKRQFDGNPYQRMGNLLKPALIRWKSNHSFRSSHYIKNARYQKILLPMRHYKFAPNLTHKIDFAIKEKVYNNGSQGYRELLDIHQNMQKKSASFLCEDSREFENFDSFKEAGISINM